MPGNENDIDENHTTCRTCSGPDNGEATVGNVWTSPKAVKNWIGGGLLITCLLLHYGLTAYNSIIITWGTSFYISDMAFLIGIAIAGNVIIKNGYRALKRLNLSIDLLITFAILGSIIASIFGGNTSSWKGRHWRFCTTSPSFSKTTQYKRPEVR